jgi:hypothetical protein
MHRINTAGHIPKEATSINRDMVRARTFNPVDLERILSRPVRTRTLSLSSVVTKPRLMPQGPASRKRY